MGDRGHAAGARHEGDRRARGQGANDGADVVAAFRARFLPGWTFRAKEHHVRDRHQAGVLAFALDGRRHARRRLAEQSSLQAVDRRKRRCCEQRKQRRCRRTATRAGPVVGRGRRPRRVPHPHFRQDAHLHTHHRPPPTPPPLILVIII